MRDEANARRKKPPNRAGCKPVEDVCVEHDQPLICRHGCDEAKQHDWCREDTIRRREAL